MSTPVVDVHCHVLPDRVRDNLDRFCASDAWFGACHTPGAAVASAEELVQAMDAAGVDRAVCFTWPFADAALCAEGNDYVAAAVTRFPGRLVGFGCVQPADPGAAAEARRCASLGLRGLGEMNADAQGWALEDAATLAPLVAASIEMGMPWTLHCSEPVGHQYAGKGTATPDRIAHFAAEYAGLRIVAAHLGGGLPFYAHMPEVRALCRSNLWFDTAAAPFLYDAAAYRTVIDLVGADRLLFGTDHPLLRAQRYLTQFAALDIDGAQRSAILGGNAVALLGL
ncbi:MAG TPA: amidohydrolase family protein [Candidatus Dormibacteraeota bacterium]|jgi:predicted TIM-barrel fold metal-dependent hydrolase|nr:amidohydrolase family protein [Candidatus Dormibacteraeota bacterium]